MKVAQVAERLAQKLLNSLDIESRKTVKLCPDVCYAAGLAHDLGHPPFGHAAEDELQKILEENGVLRDSFEGNAQSFRIVAKTSFRKVAEVEIDKGNKKEFSSSDGLDLTWRTLAAISKYPWPKNEKPKFEDARLERKLAKKWGFYDSEIEYYNYMKDNYFHQYGEDALLKQSLEAQIMDWADDITYAVHDLEDYFRGQAVPLERLALPKPPSKRIPDSEENFLELPEYVGSLSTDEWVDLYYFIKSNVQNSLFDSLTKQHIPVEDSEIFHEIISIRLKLPEAPFDGGQNSHNELRKFGSSMITYMQNNTELKMANMLGGQRKEYYLNVKKEAQLRAAILKSIFKYYVILTPQIKIMQEGQRTVIRELYEGLGALCMELADAANLRDETFTNEISKEFRQLPARLREYFINSLEIAFDEGYGSCFGEDAKKSKEKEIMCSRKKITSRPVIDFICTLTDRQATLLHKRLTGDDVGTLSPYWLNV